MSSPGIHKVTVKIPNEHYVLLKRFKGATDGEKILRLIVMANQSLTEATARAQKAAQERIDDAKPTALDRVKRALGVGA